jgi:hypothetical protein
MAKWSLQALDADQAADVRRVMDVVGQSLGRSIFGRRRKYYAS